MNDTPQTDIGTLPSTDRALAYTAVASCQREGVGVRGGGGGGLEG